MPDKKDSSKVLNVLERMGMVRKVEHDDGPALDTDDIGGLEGTGAARAESYSAPQATVVPDDFWNDTRDAAPSAGIMPDMSYSETNMEAGDTVNERTFWDETPAYGAQVTPPPEEYTDKYMEATELYTAFSMKSSGPDTIYLIEEYMKSLPDSLPVESRRAIVLKIVEASGFNFDRLLDDGIERVNKLNEYASRFAQRTDEYVAQHNAELDALEQQMQQVRAAIEKRRAMHKQQFFTIETEAQRLKKILDFITK